MYKKISRNKSFIIFSLISLSFLILFVKLSIWQFKRSDEKKIILNKIRVIDTNIKPIVHLNNLDAINNLTEYSAIKLHGKWDNQNSILLTNQFNNHKLGYHLITPFIYSNSNLAILVDRGWINNKDLINKTINTHINKKTYITGITQNSKTKQYIMGDNISKNLNTNLNINKNLHTIQKIDLYDQNLKKLYSYELNNNFIKLITPKTDGFYLNWQWTNISPEKHQAYAIQWLLLAICLVLLYSYLCFKILRNID